MGTDTCPYCGHHLAVLREERQQAGEREIRLRWLLCSHCDHVALDDWSFMSHDDGHPEGAGGAGASVESRPRPR